MVKNWVERVCKSGYLIKRKKSEKVDMNQPWKSRQKLNNDE